MSIRSTASCCQPRQLSSPPRGARTTRGRARSSAPVVPNRSRPPGGPPRAPRRFDHGVPSLAADPLRVGVRPDIGRLVELERVALRVPEEDELAPGRADDGLVADPGPVQPPDGEAEVVDDDLG